MRVSNLRITLITDEGEKEVLFMEEIKPLNLKPGEMANLNLPIVIDADGTPIVPSRRYN